MQDDAHIFCLPTQIQAEIVGVLNLTETLLSQFGFTEFEARFVCPRFQNAWAWPHHALALPGSLAVVAPAQVNLSTRPEKFVGAQEIWDQAEHALKAALRQKVSVRMRAQVRWPR